MRRLIISTFLLLSCVVMPPSVPAADLNTTMMQATCKIIGPGSLGTGFVMAKPNTNTARAFYLLITADHVLQAIQGEAAVLVMRQPAPSNAWKRVEFPVRIRIGATSLWKKHPDVDVAAMFIGLPPNTVERPVPTTLLADDETLEKYEFHPGTELLCLGYPFGAEANAYGFPILRSGRIASYPLTPTKDNRTFLFDFTVFRGNSGGPVYAVRENAIYGGGTHAGVIQCVVGIVVQERNITQTTQELYEKRETTTPLRLGEVVHASFIKELVGSMGYPE
jgi:S1-C subfamily serine protease